MLYGDTDSLFVLAPGQEGEAIAAEVNAALAGYIAGRWRVEPRFVLEYEKEYERFFLPPMRGVRRAAGQGRAKSYAGLVARPRAGGAPAAPCPAPEPDEEFRARIEVTGMEAVRRDWTDLARGFQLRLLELLFRGAPVADFRAHIAGVVRELRAGGLDGALVYRKALRKPVEGYTRNTPPHVKAAGLLAPGDRRGLIRYVLTVEGPQPAGRLTARIDYDHYVEKQLKPIAAGFTEVLGTSVEVLFGEERQLSLF